MATVLIADDEANLRKILRVLLEREGYKALAVPDGASALKLIQEGGIDVVISDLKMPGMGGLELLSAVKQADPGLPVILITAHGTIDTAVSALKKGAFDYITKPFDKNEIQAAVKKAAATRQSNQSQLQDSYDNTGRFRIIGQSPKMRDIYTIIEKIAATPSTVLITGESGTGKELVASALHENSGRSHKPFIKVNCAAIPKDLIESEFFGYEQGAFTGAVASKPGRFELADGGTLFLDEIGEIPNAMQVKLLRALQECEFERVGGVRTLKVDVRVVAATNRDLAEEIKNGHFREDLYYRLNVVPIALPPLRQRPEDIPLLVDAFLEKYNKRLNKHVTGIHADAVECLMQHPWPGNIRELENVIERTLLFSDHAFITPDDLPEEFKKYHFAPVMPTTSRPFPTQPQPQPSSSEMSGSSFKELVKQATSEVERDLIVKALEETGGNVTRAAHVLQISRKGLQNKMKELGLREEG